MTDARAPSESEVDELLRDAYTTAMELDWDLELDDILRTPGRPPKRKAWRRAGVLLVAAVILVVFFVPLPHVGLFNRLVTATKLSAPPAIGTQLAALKDPDIAVANGSDTAVAISGTTAVIAADQYRDSDGLAYIFTNTTSGWRQVTELKGSDNVGGEDSGLSVAIAGTTVVVAAAYQVLPPAGHYACFGRVYVFTKTPARWRQVAELKSPETLGTCTNISVAVSGATAVVGQTYGAGPSASPLSLTPGAAYVYTKAASGWRQTATLRGSDTAALNGFGNSVAISGTTVIVGAIAGQANPDGRAYVFTKLATGWRRVAELRGSHARGAASFGFSVAISKSTTVVGGDGTGPVYVFTRAPTGWRQTGELKGSDAGDGFGSAVAISGTTAIVGSDLYTNTAGRAYVFTKRAGTWVQVAELKGSDAVAGDGFGSAVAISSNTAVVASPGSRTFALYVFRA